MAFVFSSLADGPGYLPTNELNQQLQDLARRRPDLVRVEMLARSAAGGEVLVASVGALAPETSSEQPALLAVAGLEGNDLAGTASLVYWLGELVGQYDLETSIRELLNRTTIHVIPRLNAEAADLSFASPRRESLVNLTPFDDDHDGIVDEDGPEDLNQDGQVTLMRIKDLEGEFILDPKDARLMIKADPAKGEKGEWRLLPEGRDSDNDEAWNEDPAGGVNLNRNFPYGYRYFAPDAGLHPLSEDVARALAEFVIARPNLGIIFAFGSGDVLSQVPKAEPPKLPPVTVNEKDIDIFRELGKQWRQTIGLQKEVSGSTAAGSFASWAYFHRGRLGLETRAWSPAIQLAMEKSSAPEGPAGSGESKTKFETVEGENDAPGPKSTQTDEKRNEVERAFIGWLDKWAPGMFIPWKAYEHPDFTNQVVEIGGFAPLASDNPPVEVLAGIVERHARFLTSLAGRLPRLAVRKAGVKALGNDVFELVIQVENNGYLPTSLAHGTITREVSPTRVEVALPDKQVLAGSARTVLEAISGSGGMREVRLVVFANGQRHVAFTVTSTLAGQIRGHVVLQ